MLPECMTAKARSVPADGLGQFGNSSRNSKSDLQYQLEMGNDNRTAAEEWANQEGAHSYAWQWAVDAYMAGAEAGLRQYSDEQLTAELYRRQSEKTKTHDHEQSDQISATI